MTFCQSLFICSQFICCDTALKNWRFLFGLANCQKPLCLHFFLQVKNGGV